MMEQVAHKSQLPRGAGSLWPQRRRASTFMPRIFHKLLRLQSNDMGDTGSVSHALVSLNVQGTAIGAAGVEALIQRSPSSLTSLLVPAMSEKEALCAKAHQRIGHARALCVWGLGWQRIA
ncbi:Aste57867_25556 [Aphanomyces stellatus]|uniref:Aste57867_25556 protein n=1 Tax=Aphanomyces stellatus TaxID=120398 RepID=A0A485LY98_9STRA|nr:hypothetical protein As57867_025477 [Aphanomyces stellatus]VFU02179.1 Aste57867_25556 [Aphanomyces stellatus]